MDLEAQLGKLARLAGAAFAAALGILILLAVIGAYFPAVLYRLGMEWLYVPTRGIYTDCSDPANREMIFCKPKEERFRPPPKKPSATRLKNRQEPPFSLHSNDH